MLQKKICMVGVFGTGKTCLVRRYVHSIFSDKYLGTVGVKIDRKEVDTNGQPVVLLLWDLEGRDGHRDISTSYLRGAHGIIYVVDGTRRETFDQTFEIREIVRGAVGDVPSVLALNKVDLVDAWKLDAAAEESAAGEDWHKLRTSAKTGEGVELAFQWLAQATVAAS
ncbi:MAG: Rab family GTPase [Gemmatimonadaceae bacterium]